MSWCALKIHFVHDYSVWIWLRIHISEGYKCMNAFVNWTIKTLWWVHWKWTGSRMLDSEFIEFNLGAFVLSINPWWFLASCVLHSLSVLFSLILSDVSSEIQFTFLFLLFFLFFFFCSHLTLLTSQTMMKDFFII